MLRWVIFFLTIISFSDFGQQRIEGIVVDKLTKQPVPYASIGIIGTHKGTSSNFDGQFSLAIDGPCEIKISCVGYESYSFHTSNPQPVIALTPSTVELRALYVYRKPINALRVVQRAFASIHSNYSTESFLQQYFYRHYCMDDSVYGRLIEAYVEVWKKNGYQPKRTIAGDREAIRVTQLRRSLDKTSMAQGHETISVGNILEADLIAYQTAEQTDHLKFYQSVSNIKTDFSNYIFTFNGVTSYDGHEVYKIHYAHQPDSIPTTKGYSPAPMATGTLFITTDNYVIIKAEEVKKDEINTISTKISYSKNGSRYYPYHFIREGVSKFSSKGGHAFHIEMIAVDTQLSTEPGFETQATTRENLLHIEYDSSFWNTAITLKTTPLEEQIIEDLGGGRSLNEQFSRYQQYEWSTHKGGDDSEEKFRWLLNDSKGERILYLVFWDSNSKNYLFELEDFKRLNKKYRGRITFVMLSLENNKQIWEELITKYNLFAEGILNYCIGTSAGIIESFPIAKTPAYFIVSKNGKLEEARPPGDPLIGSDLNGMLNQSLDH